MNSEYSMSLNRAQFCTKIWNPYYTQITKLKISFSTFVLLPNTINTYMYYVIWIKLHADYNYESVFPEYIACEVIDVRPWSSYAFQKDSPFLDIFNHYMKKNGGKRCCQTNFGKV